MSQREFLQAFDAAAMEAFHGAGMADDALYLAPGALPLPVRVMVDRDLRDFGSDEAPVATRYTQITFQRSQVQPVRGARVTVDGDTFALDAELESDEARSVWVVTRG
ncbi:MULTISPECIES: head-tail joining protein [Xanthomonas]|uniref:SnoaL-like domain-containing protein n=2 Tax=Xanthomonas citri TaxID=346 RepID=A0AB33CNS0_XANCI|nr:MULTISPECIES: hypothetical protein [Xanthomonas]MBV6780957.1 hypothetical protein [Xanthomonas campestris pv. trichodesmae]ASK91873.1 hypothetical protein XcvCFBP7111P_10455 [Xanthomonas citri pv. vignicola]MBV6788481.1 hypothetical protein [Xanthomonas campestris pv. clerodendri]MBZ3919204.1 hypothetical protein [Xanthomonas campestris pv. trichodesmae]MBZ3922915.1 hypothetical protein [Xanthomonas citri pv. sesbaniae]